MEVILGGRKTGRTNLLISLAAEAESKGEICYIVCRNHQQAQTIAQRAKELDLKIGYPITYDEFMSQRYAQMNIKRFYIDNADHFLQSLTHVEISAVTMEKEDNYDRTT